MKVQVEFVGAINTGIFNKQHEFNIEKNSTVKNLLEKLEHFDKSHLNFIQVLQNGKRVSHNQKLKNGDKLELMLMVGGG
jgi:sulfur carrier protein ThiS